MKLKDLDNWKNIDENQGLLFFAQTLDELLFDYTLDSYKPMALNIRVLCIETLRTIEDIKKGLIKPQNLKHIIEELKWSLNNDLIARELLKDKLQRFESQLNKNHNNGLSRLKETVQLLYHYFDNQKYLNAIKQNLQTKIETGREKEKIYKLTKTFVTELINYGYNPNYIYFQVNNFFYNKTEISDSSQIEDFFKLFRVNRSNYTCVFKGSKLFLEFQDSVESLNMEITDKVEPFSKMDGELDFCKNLSDKEVFIIVKDVEALDHPGARIQAEHRINRLANLFSFFHHKERPSINENAIIQRIDDNYVTILGNQAKSIIKKQDVKPSVAAKSVANVVDNLYLTSQTIYQLGRAIDLHSSALETDEVENQLLNLWTAIETLIPKVEDLNQDRINQLIDSLVPFLVFNYNRRLIQEFINDLSIYNIDFTREIRSQIKTSKRENYINSFAALISTPDNKEIRDKINDELEHFPLLQFRLFRLNKIFSSPKEINKLNLLHRQKIEWQIRRIYRTRNLIVHAGKVPSYTGILVQNLHTYLDIFLETIIEMSEKEKIIKTMNQGVIEMNFRVENYLEILEKESKNATELENFKKVIFQ